MSNFTYGTPSGVYVNASFYNKDTTTGSSNWGNAWRIASNATQAIDNNHAAAIRQTGIIKYVEFDCIDATLLSSYKVNVWRINGSAYDLVAQSANLCPQMINGTNNISVALPVQEGDFLGESVIGVGNSGYALYAANSSTCKYFYGYDPVMGGTNSTNFNWDAMSSINAAHIILAKIESPDVVFIGDSICSGIPGHAAHLTTSSATNILSSYEYWMQSCGNITYQNMGIGSQTTSQIAARFQTDVVNLHPKFAVIEGGVNDVSGGVNNETVLGNYETMLAACEASGIKPVIVLILPWHAGTTTQKKQIDYLNEQLILKASEHNCAYIDCRDTVGYYNTAIGSWDVDNEYNADGVHYTVAGYTALGQEMFKQWAGITVDGMPYNVINSTSGNISVNMTDDIDIVSNLQNMYADINIYRQNVKFSTISEGTVTSVVKKWGTAGEYSKIWSAASTDHSTVTRFVIGDFPVNTPVQIKRDGVNYIVVTSNETGYIDWIYSGGYSEHTFEATVTAPVSEVTDYSFAPSWLSTIGLVGVCILLTLVAQIVLMLRGKGSIKDIEGDVSGIVIVLVIILVGTILFSQL